MDEPLLASERRTRLHNTAQERDGVAVAAPDSVSDRRFPCSVPADQGREQDSEFRYALERVNSTTKHKLLHRCFTAPAMMNYQRLNSIANRVAGPQPFSKGFIWFGLAALFAYLVLGILLFWRFSEDYNGDRTDTVVDALYFCIVTICTIGYGDITPNTTVTKLLAIAFVLTGFGLLDVLLNKVLNRVLDLQEKMIIARILMGSPSNSQRFLAIDHFVDLKKRRMRIRTKVGIALAVVVLCIGAGVLVLYFVEEKSWIDSLYVSVMSVTTVGYGDIAFKSSGGRLFAVIWLFVSTLVVARSFVFLAEMRMGRGERQKANTILTREVTAQDLRAADINHNGFISKSEFVIFKLKEMGKIDEKKDVEPICQQFNRIDRHCLGRIRLSETLWDQ